MALTSLADLSIVDANNTSFSGITQAENSMLPSNVNDAFRATDGSIARYLSDLAGTNQTVGGTANAITVTVAQTWTALANGLRFAIKNTVGPNTGATTIAVTNSVAGALGTKAIRLQGDSALVGGEMLANGIYEFRYDTSYNTTGAWVLLNPAVSLSFATPAQALAGTSATLIVNPTGLYYPTGHLFGLTLSNNAGTPASKIDVAAGTCRDSTDTANFSLAAALTAKDLASAWAVGSSAGLLDTGAIANTTYHIYMIKRVDTGVVDVIASASASAPTLPANYTLYRRVGSIIRVGGSIVAFTQFGDLFLRTTTVLDVSAANPGTSAVTRTLSVPTGIKVVAQIRQFVVNLSSGGTVFGLVTGLDVADAVPAASTTPLSDIPGVSNVSGASTYGNGAVNSVLTNTSAQVRSRLSYSDANVTHYMATLGWTDLRGRAL